jgi:hypothetical protein
MPTALAPFIIRWGSEASGDVLRRSARWQGRHPIGPHWKGMQDDAETFSGGADGSTRVRIRSQLCSL